MAISHADHDHPNTPAARAACRKAMAINAEGGLSAVQARLVDGAVTKAAKVTVVPRTRGDGGVVKGMIAAQPVVKGTKVKAYETPIRTAGDLPADIPPHLVRTIEAAWEAGLPVVKGMRLNDAETRILIGGKLAQVALVFNGAANSGVFVRSLTSSVTHRVDSGPQALALASGDEDWPWVTGGKRV